MSDTKRPYEFGITFESSEARLEHGYIVTVHRMSDEPDVSIAWEGCGMSIEGQVFDDEAGGLTDGEVSIPIDDVDWIEVH